MRRLLAYIRPYKFEVGTALVLLIANAGFQVAGPLLTKYAIDRYLVKADHRDGTLHLVEVREILEPEIAAMAAKRADKESVEQLREAMQIMENAKDDPEQFIEADLDFHLALAEAAANPLILSLIDSIVGLLREQRMSIFNVEGGSERGQYHHKRILEAIENRDAAGAREAMHSHLRQVRQDSGHAASDKS